MRPGGTNSPRFTAIPIASDYAVSAIPCDVGDDGDHGDSLRFVAFTSFRSPVLIFSWTSGELNADSHYVESVVTRFGRCRPDLAQVIDRILAGPASHSAHLSGDMKCTLFPDKAPKAVANFIGLA